MKNKRLIFIRLVWLVFLANLLVPWKVAAQGIEVTPASWEFGNVELGASVSRVFTITSTEPTPLIVYSVSITDDLTSSFSFDSAVPPPQVTIYTGYPGLEIELAFSPATAGLHTANLFIESDAGPPRNELYIEVQGFGVEPGISPAERISEIIELFNNSVSDGSLVGSGPGQSTENRLSALNNMLLSVQELIESGDYEGACGQLFDTANKCDGNPIPPDFVVGDAALNLFESMLDLQTSLACI